MATAFWVVFFILIETFLFWLRLFYFDWGSPGGNIGGDCLAAFSPASFPPSPHCLLFALISLVLSNMSSLLLWCCDQCWQGAGLNCSSPNPAPWTERAPRSGGQLYSGRPRGTLIGKKNVARVTRPIQGPRMWKLQPLLPHAQPRLLSSAFMSSLNEGYASSHPVLIDKLLVEN